MVLQARGAGLGVPDDLLQLLRRGRDGVTVLRGQRVVTILLLVLEAEDALHLLLDGNCFGPDLRVAPVRYGPVLLAIVVLLGARLHVFVHGAVPLHRSAALDYLPVLLLVLLPAEGVVSER